MAELGGDVVVIGLGAMGSATLWRLASRGVRAVGVEQFTPGHDRGSSHGQARIIRSAYFEDPRYVPLIAHAFHFWDKLQAETGQPLLLRTGALMIGSVGSELVTGTLCSVEEHKLAHEVLNTAALAARYPQHRLLPGEVAVYEDAAGVLNPELCVVAATERAEQLGATVLCNTMVERIETTDEGVEVWIGGVAYSFRKAVVAVGPWLGDFLPGLKLPLQVERQVQVWFPLSDPALYSPERCPVYIRQLPSGINIYGFPSLDGAVAKIGIHHAGATTDPRTVDRSISPADTERLQSVVTEYFTGLDSTPARATVCMYTNTPDENFVVGPAPGMPNVTVLGGFSGHGFKFAPVLGDVAADFVQTGKTGYPIGLFAPDRFS